MINIKNKETNWLVIFPLIEILVISTLVVGGAFYWRRDPFDPNNPLVKSYSGIVVGWALFLLGRIYGILNKVSVGARNSRIHPELTRMYYLGYVLMVLGLIWFVYVLVKTT